MLSRNRLLHLILLGILILLSGCSFVRIQNVSSNQITVLVQVPDAGSGYTRNIDSGGIVDVFSSHGGRYTVTLIPSEEYRALLTDLQQQVGNRLFEERGTLTAAEVAILVERLNSIDQALEELTKPGATCSGTLPEYDTVVVTVAFDSINSEYSLSCQ